MKLVGSERQCSDVKIADLTSSTIPEPLTLKLETEASREHLGTNSFALLWMVLDGKKVGQNKLADLKKCQVDVWFWYDGPKKISEKCMSNIFQLEITWYLSYIVGSMLDKSTLTLMIPDIVALWPSTIQPPESLEDNCGSGITHHRPGLRPLQDGCKVEEVTPIKSRES